jgi:hypothetical protein
VKLKKKPMMELVVSFSGALEPAPAQNLTDYQIDAPARSKRFGTRYTKAVKLASATYSPTAMTVTLVPRGTVPNQPLQLTIVAAGTLDAQGRPIDGNRDGQPGGDFQAVFTRAGLTVPSVAAAGHEATVSAHALEALPAGRHVPARRVAGPERPETSA